MYLEVFHEDVCQNRGQGRTHCCSFHLLIEGLTKLEVHRLQAKFHEGAEVRDGDTGSFFKSHPAAGGVRGPGVPHPLVP